MGSVEIEEDQLWARSLRGEGDAFGSLFDLHHDRVFRHAFRLTGDRQDAEDIMSTAFLELWRRRLKVRVIDGSVLPWLLVTTTNVARNSERAARRYRKLLNSLPRTVEASDSSAAAEGVLEPLDGKVSLALGALNAKDLRLVSLVVFEDYSLADAADVLQITPGAAKTRVHRARQRMKEAINKAGGSMPIAVAEGKSI